jgi:hypothetical protein
MRSFKNFISEKVEPARGIKPKAGDEAQFMDKHVVDVRDDPHNDKETKDGIKNSPAKKKRMADNDQASAEAAYEEMDPVGKEDDDVDNDGDSDESDEYLKKRRKAIKKAVSKEGTQKPYVSSDRDGKHVMNSSGKVDKTFPDMNSANAYLKKHYNRLMKEDTDDNPANRWHLCAKQVVHETWGEGVCIETQHADPDMEGNVDWYDVMFGHGVETKVSISELKVTKSEDHVHSSYKMKKKKMNEMSDAQMKKREEIVKSMKDKTADFKKRYGDQWKSVMYATATKQAMKEEVDLDEADRAVAKRRYDDAQRALALLAKERRLAKAAGKVWKANDAKEREYYRLRSIVDESNESVDFDEARRGRPPKNANADGGMENIQMQLRKAISMNGQKEVEFHDGSKSKISQGMARAVLGKIDKMRQPKDKQNASRYIAKSLSNLKAFATGKEKGMDPEVEKQKILNLKSGYGSKMEETQVIDEAYKAGIVNLKDGSKIRIASEDAKALNGLYSKLNASNKKQMEQRMMKDKKSFSEIIAFAKETVQ